MAEIKEDLEIEAIDIGELGLRPSSSKQSSRNASQKSALTVVNTKNNGMRIAIALEVINKIDSPERVQVAMNEKGIAIGVDFTGDNNYFQLKKAARKAVIYSSQLVNEVTETFGLDFTNVTSISFQDVSYLKVNDQLIAFVPLVRGEPKVVIGSDEFIPQNNEFDSENDDAD